MPNMATRSNYEKNCKQPVSFLALYILSKLLGAFKQATLHNDNDSPITKNKHASGSHSIRHHSITRFKEDTLEEFCAHSL